MGIAPKADRYKWSHFRAGCAVPGVGYLEIDNAAPSGGYRWSLRPPTSERIIADGIAADEEAAKAAAERAADALQLRANHGEVAHVYNA